MPDLDKIIAINRQRLGLDEHDKANDIKFTESCGAAIRLCVYGTLRPGEENFHLMEPLNGEWEDVTYPGYYTPPDDSYDYPRIAWTPEGDENPGKLITSPGLSSKWPNFDAFEGDDYCRILTPVESKNGPVISNIYAFVATTRTQLMMMDGMNVHDDRD